MRGHTFPSPLCVPFVHPVGESCFHRSEGLRAKRRGGWHQRGVQESDDVCLEEPMMSVEGMCTGTTQDGGCLFNRSALAYVDSSASCTGTGLPAGYLWVCIQMRIQTWICRNPAPNGIWTRRSYYLQVFLRVYLQVTCKDLDPQSALAPSQDWWYHHCQSCSPQACQS